MCFQCVQNGFVVAPVSDWGSDSLGRFLVSLKYAGERFMVANEVVVCCLQAQPGTKVILFQFICKHEKKRRRGLHVILALPSPTYITFRYGPWVAM